MKRANLFRAALMGLVILGAAAPAAPARADNCAIPAAQARRLIAQQGLISAGKARQIAAARAAGRAFYVKLCRSGNSYYYSVNVMQGGKKLVTVTVNARQ